MTGSAVSIVVERPEAELTLIESLRLGDPAALETLMERYASRVYRLAYGITKNEADAEEVVQDVFLSVFRKIDRFEGRAGLWTWMYRVTVNASLIKRRGKRAETEVLLEDWLPTFAEDGHRAGDRAMLLADWSATPEEELLSRETRALVRRAIDRLPDHYKLVLLLRDMEELSNEETADVLGETIGSVKTRLHRARMALREQITWLVAPRPAEFARQAVARPQAGAVVADERGSEVDRIGARRRPGRTDGPEARAAGSSSPRASGRGRPGR